MKLTLKKLAALASVMALPCFATAAPTVQFQGEVTDQTCEVNINGETNSTVLLPTVNTSDFAGVGSTAGVTPFTTTLSNCGDVAKGKAITANFLGHNVTKSGVLGNTAIDNPAETVGIQLLETDAQDATPIVLLAGVTPSISKMTFTADSADTSVSHTFGAAYYAIDKATAGKVKAVAEYTVSYN